MGDGGVAYIGLGPKNVFLLLPYFWTLVGGWAVVGSPGEAEAQNKSLPGQPHQTNQKRTTKNAPTLQNKLSIPTRSKWNKKKTHNIKKKPVHIHTATHTSNKTLSWISKHNPPPFAHTTNTRTWQVARKYPDRVPSFWNTYEIHRINFHLPHHSTSFKSQRKS